MSRLSPIDVNYLRQLVTNEYFVTRWGGLIVRDFEKSSGYLKQFATIRDYECRELVDDFWIYLQLKVFRSPDRTEYPIFCCPQCPVMAAVPSLLMQQAKSDVEALRCSHSIVAQYLCQDTWRQKWQIPNFGE